MNRQERRRLQREEEKKHKKVEREDVSTTSSTVKFVCLQCNIEDDIPVEVVDYCDMMGIFLFRLDFHVRFVVER